MDVGRDALVTVHRGGSPVAAPQRVLLQHEDRGCGRGLQHPPRSECLSGVRLLLSMTLLLSLVIPSAAHARRRVEHAQPSAVIFPGSRRMPPEPLIWVATRGEPAPKVTSGGRPVPFILVPEEFHLAGDNGLHWAEMIVELRAGTFTVEVGSERATFTIDPSLAPQEGGAPPQGQVGGQVEGQDGGRDDDLKFERMGIDRGDTLTIDAIVPPDTVLYFRNLDAPAGRPTYVWIGPGRQRGGSRRFEVPLALLDMSCSASKSVTLSLYSTTFWTTTLYPLSELTIDRGRVKLPTQSIWYGEKDQPWRPCPGASVDIPSPAEQAAAEEPAAEPEPQPEPPLARQVAVRAEVPWPFSVLDDAPAAAEPADPGTRSWWWSAALALLAGLCAALARRLPVRHHL